MNVSKLDAITVIIPDKYSASKQLLYLRKVSGEACHTLRARACPDSDVNLFAASRIKHLLVHGPNSQI